MRCPLLLSDELSSIIECRACFCFWRGKWKLLLCCLCRLWIIASDCVCFWAGESISFGVRLLLSWRNLLYVLSLSVLSASAFELEMLSAFVFLRWVLCLECFVFCLLMVESAEKIISLFLSPFFLSFSFLSLFFSTDYFTKWIEVVPLSQDSRWSNSYGRTLYVLWPTTHYHLWQLDELRQ